MSKIKIYKTTSGTRPFVKWYSSLKSKNYKFRILKRLQQIRLGNFGDHKSIGNGVFELRFFFGSGYRIYYAKGGNEIVILLAGGDKSNQDKDIKNAKKYWEDYKEKDSNKTLRGF